MFIPRRRSRTKSTIYSSLVAFVACASSAFAAAADVDEHTAGALEAFAPDGSAAGACPLKHTDVEVDISGFIARVTLTQQFSNAFETPIEAVYTFPMSDRAAVDSMTMHIGDRVIKGKIDRREAARAAYEAAKASGKTAGLLDQERPNIFTQSVANILPGDDIRITISYVEYLEYEQGEYEFSFPMVVGPRFIPGNVTDAAKIAPPVTAEGTRAGHDISLAVNLDAGVPVQAIRSVLHEIDTFPAEGSKARVELAAKREIPNRDFVLQYDVAGEEVEDAVLTHAGENGNFFTLILQPPDRVAPSEAAPKEMIFVVDCSGSMSGFPLDKAKATMEQAIRGMNPQDTFNLISFAGGLGYCFEGSMPNTPANVRTALEYLNNLRGGGGTQMMPAIQAALADQHDDDRLRVVCFMTDGFIGNDMQILDAIQKNRHQARVFAFGIGNGVNRFLLENMGREGRGATEIVTLESEGDAAVKRFHERIHNPVLTDISFDFEGIEVTDLTPAADAVPDLFDAQPLFVTGRYAAGGKGTVTVRGRTADGLFERTISVEFPEVEPAHDVLGTLWARAQIDDLMARDWMGMQTGSPVADVEERITELGLDFGLVTQFTSFVAIEEIARTTGGQVTTVHVPVEMTDGVSYEGVFGDATVGHAPVPQSLSTPMRAPRMERETLGDRDQLRRSFQKVSGGVAEERIEVSNEAADVAPVSPRTDDVSLKLHPSLVGLAAKVKSGSYRDADVAVEAGLVKVYVQLADDSASSIADLEHVGADVLAHVRSSKRVLVRIPVEALDELARLDFVTFISPHAV